MTPDPSLIVQMRRALDLVAVATHRVSPNPMVGCVLLDADGAVVGEGITQRPGCAHAEIEALRMAGSSARGGRMFVTLEPCCHHGRTTPCTDAIIAAGITHVYVGTLDPNPLVAGGGVAALRGAGLSVEVGIEGDAAARSISAFRKHIETGRPWVLLKAAVTLDGRIGTTEGHSKWITGPEARADVHRLRAAADAVLVGAGTARADDPRLTVRDVPGEDPRPVLLDARLSLPGDLAALRPGALVAHGPDVDRQRAARFTATGAELVEVGVNAHGRLDLGALLDALGARGVLNLLVEGGGVLHGALLADRLADEACFYIAPKFIGRGRPVIDLPSVSRVDLGWSLERVEHRVLGVDARIRGLIRYPAAPQDAQ